MQLTRNDVLILANLQLQLFNTKSAMNVLKDLIKQLATDHCSITMQFVMHNMATHEKNEVSKKMQIMESGYEMPEIIMMGNITTARLKTPPPLPECRYDINYTTGEATGMRILNLLLQQKKEEADAIQLQIEKILLPVQFVETENPIQLMHQKTEP